jgi:hypothetical protein
MESRRNVKLQSAMEYLTTYAWAILILVIVLGALFYMHLFSPQGVQECLLPANFNCLEYNLYQNGTLLLNLQQATPYQINITSVGCEYTESFSKMQAAVPQVSMQIQSNHTFFVQCYGQNGSAIVLSPGDEYTGYIEVNYTDLQTGFPHTSAGRIMTKAV